MSLLRFIKDTPPSLILPFLTICYSILAAYLFIIEYILSSSSNFTPTPILFPQLFTLLFLLALPLTLIPHLLNKRSRFFSESCLILILFLLLFTIYPRSFTYDTGLYHAPFVQHLSSIGLEWNLGWLHSRYAYFNLLLYGQALLARSFLGIHLLPSLNSIIIISTLAYLYSLCKTRPDLSCTALVFCSGMVLVPSESSESFHSYNSDFSLGLLLFVITLYLLYDKRRSTLPIIGFLILSLPFIKLSGLTQAFIILPLLLQTCLSKAKPNIRHLQRACLLTLLLILPLVFSTYVMTGYAVYPLSSSGPLRPDSIPLESVVLEVKNSTIAWARFAYSNQISNLHGDASLFEWFPLWSISLNGKRMIGFSILSLFSLLPFNLNHFRFKLTSYEYLVAAPLFLYWLAAIFLLPPDPRFYLGPILLSIFFFIRTFKINVYFVAPPYQLLAFSVVSFVIFTSLWRSSHYEGLGHPIVDVRSLDPNTYHPYVIPPSTTLNTPLNSEVCWTAPSPCR